MEDFGKLLSGMRSKASLKDKIRIAVDRLLHMDDGLTVEDKYELESCKLLTYENLFVWTKTNAPSDFEGALLCRFKSVKSKMFPLMVSVVYLLNDQPLLGKEYSKKIFYCAAVDGDLEQLFNGKDLVIIE